MGGNVFKNPETVRINRNEVQSIVDYFSQLFDCDMNQYLVGSAESQIKDTYGDIDFAVTWEKQFIRDRLNEKLKQENRKPDNIKSTGGQIHYRTNCNHQVDFMIVDNVAFAKFVFCNRETSLSGTDRNILLSYIAKRRNYRWGMMQGLKDRDTDQIISRNPEEIARLIIDGKPENLETVQSIITFLQSKYSQHEIDDLLVQAKL